MTPQQKKLQRLFTALPTAERETLLAFAEFLAARSQPEVAAVQEPQRIPRPRDESVVAAMKRLSASFPMLDKAKVLNEASALMAQHILHGREAEEVIDELETLFETHYHRLREAIQSEP